MSQPIDRSPTQRRALGWLAFGALVAVAWLALPFATALLLGTLLAFIADPAYRTLLHRTGRPIVSSLAVVAASAVILIGSLAGFVTLFISHSIDFANATRAALQPGGMLNASLVSVTHWFARFGISSESLAARLEAGAGEIASRSASLTASIATGTLGLLLAIFFALLAMHFVLSDRKRIVAKISLLSPLRPDYTRHLLDEFQRVGRMTVLGTALTGLAQGALATVGFWITGVPQPIFFGITTALASLIPAVGTLLVWVPAGIYLFATGSPGSAIIELCWGALVVVGFSDYVIRPRLVGDEAMPTLLVFIALFGGVEAIGLAGLIVGPVVLSLAVAILRLYTREQQGVQPTQPAARVTEPIGTDTIIPPDRSIESSHR